MIGREINVEAARASAPTERVTVVDTWESRRSVVRAGGGARGPSAARGTVVG